MVQKTIRMGGQEATSTTTSTSRKVDNAEENIDDDSGDSSIGGRDDFLYIFVN